MTEAIEQVEQVKKARKPAGYCACGAPLHTRAAGLGKCKPCRKAETRERPDRVTEPGTPLNVLI